MKSLLTNWKTTSAGLLIIVQAIVHMSYEIKSSTTSENSWMIAATSILGGIGLMFAGDSSNSTQNKDKK